MVPLGIDSALFNESWNPNKTEQRPETENKYRIRCFQKVTRKALRRETLVLKIFDESALHPESTECRTMPDPSESDMIIMIYFRV